MANARTRFDTICDYMVRSHGATAGSLYGKPCALVRGHAFLYFHQGWAAFKLRGRVRLQALALAGAKFWDPLGRDGPSMEWVIVPDAHFLRWDRFAVEAVKQVEKDAGGRRPEAGPAQGPPPLPPASLRWLDSIKTLWSRAANLTLARHDPVPEKPVSTLFSETITAPEPAEARAFAELAETAQDVPTSSADSAASPSEPAEPALGRASFAVGADPVPPAPRVGGRASFNVGVDPAPAASASPAPPPAASGKASFDVGTDPMPAASPSSEGRASFHVGVDPSPPMPPAEGRASFGIGTDPAPPAAAEVNAPDATGSAAAAPAAVTDITAAPAEATDAAGLGLSDEPLQTASGDAPSVEEGLAAWQERIAKYEIEAEQADTLIRGRAVFEAREVEPVAVEKRFQIKQDKPLGRASFLLPDDVPATPSDEPESLDYPPKPPSDAD